VAVRAFALGAALCGMACDSACENAQEKLDGECKDEIARAHEDQSYSGLPLAGGSEECNEREHCIAECINDADCPAIAFVMATGGMIVDPNAPYPDGVGPFMSCLRDCVPELYGG
jgi:hypothetical protein